MDRPALPDPITDPATGTAPAARIRVSDAERVATVLRLQDALAQGRLELDETDERVAAAFAARYDGDLQRLVTDLPPHVPVTDGAPAWSAVGAAAVWRARVLVLGAEAAGHTRPTPQQCRVAVALAALAVVWMFVCAVAGAALVA